MPLSPFQREILRLLAVGRTPESYVAGGTPITRKSTRYSGDLGIFNDRQELIKNAANVDVLAIEKAGYEITWIRQLPGIWSAAVVGGPEPLKLEWAHDSGYRFYPAQKDRDFGYILHPADLATNKVLAAAGRREARDLVDLVQLSQRVPIAAAIIAAPAKDPGFTPQSLIDHISRFSNHRQEAFDALRSTEPIEGAKILEKVRSGLNDAREAASHLRAEDIGRLYLYDWQIETPRASRMGAYVTRDACTGGIVPRIDGVPAAEMAERYKGGDGIQ